MIKPKHSFGKKTFTVSENFVDRKEAIQLYRDKIENNNKEYNILNFYGVGGIGKSKLRREICRMHNEDYKESAIMYLDLNAPDDRNMGKGILKLADSCVPKIDFKCFEMAYALYFRKKNQSALYGRDKAMVTDNTFVNISLNILGVFDNGITSTAAEIVEKSVRAISNRTINKDVKEELKHFDDYSVAEIEERLPLFLQYDLMCYQKKHPNIRTLIVFDTFEAVNENVIEQIHKRKNERWIQDIISYFDAETFPKLLILVFGRDKIEWDDEWQQCIEQYQLTEFDDQYSKEYLKIAGINDSSIIDAIIESSKGYPFLLYLSLEIYSNIKNSGREPEVKDFAGSYPEIIERFIYNLDKDSVEVLRLMSIPNFYNTKIFSLLIKNFNLSFPLTEFEQFNKYSFVSSDESGQDFFIHALMREGIQEQTDSNLIKKVHECMLQYYSEKVSESFVTKYIMEMFYHARICKDVDQFNLWLNQHITEDLDITPLQGIKREQQRGEQSTLIQIIDGIKSSYSVASLSLDLVNVYIDIVHLGGNYDTAVAICDRYLSPYSLSEIMNDEQLLKMRIRKIHHSMFYLPVDKLLEDAETLAEYQEVKRYPEQYNELLFLIGGNLGVLSGNGELCEKWLELSMNYAKDNKLTPFIHRTLRKQADILLMKGDIDGALNLLDGIVSCDMESCDIDSRYKIYLMGTLGEIYRKQGSLDKALHSFELVNKKSTERNLPGWKSHSYLGMGMVELQQGDYQQADLDFKNAMEIYNRINQAWGQISVEEARLILEKRQGKSLLKDDVDKCKQRAETMNYRYNIHIAEELSQGREPYMQLLLL